MGCSCSGERGCEEPKDLTEPLFTEIVNSQIEEHEILLYTLAECEKCKKAKNILKQSGVEFEYFDLDKLQDDKKILYTLQKMTNYRKAPYFFYKGTYKGGLHDLEGLIQHGFIK
ncbi:hypothetical protein SteCoe_312 [Stentor coeruleus]|uniref:Glutaredoxin domain-containing protein n=1 Tax=Stentor coeruleus TaxID=5963 RepID=A0A1R2D4E3_9CILI|nr:hypothetical protein SteCoe_312 [Stentor coeruleus]